MYFFNLWWSIITFWLVQMDVSCPFFLSLPSSLLCSYAKFLTHVPHILSTSFGLWLALKGGTVVKDLPATAGGARDAVSIPRLRRSPGVGNGYPLQYSCLKNSTDRGAWRAAVLGVAKSQKRLSMHTRAWHWYHNSPGKNTGMGCRFLLQGDLPNPGINLGLSHCWQIPYCLSHRRSPIPYALPNYISVC